MFKFQVFEYIVDDFEEVFMQASSTLKLSSVSTHSDLFTRWSDSSSTLIATYLKLKQRFKTWFGKKARALSNKRLPNEKKIDMETYQNVQINYEKETWEKTLLEYFQEIL